MTLNGVIAFILRFFSPNLIALQAAYVTVVEDSTIMPVNILPVPVFHFWPKLAHLQRGFSAIAEHLVILYTPPYRCLVRQAKITFIPNCWYQEFEFLISAIVLLISTICWYQEFKYWYRIYIVDIRNSFADINNWNNSWYQKFVFSISAIGIMLTSRITITATLHYWYRQFNFLIPVITIIVDISKSISW